MKNILYIIIISIILSILFNLIYIKYNNIYNKNNNIDTVEIVKVDTFIKKDTLFYPKPYPVKIEIKDTIYLPIDSVKTEGDSILLPRESKTYEDSTYRAVVSGYKPSLDTLMVFPKTYTIEKTKTVTVTKKNHWNYGIGVGVGYGIFNRKFDMYAGFTVGYTF